MNPKIKQNDSNNKRNIYHHNQGILNGSGFISVSDWLWWLIFLSYNILPINHINTPTDFVIDCQSGAAVHITCNVQLLHNYKTVDTLQVHGYSNTIDNRIWSILLQCPQYSIQRQVVHHQHSICSSIFLTDSTLQSLHNAQMQYVLVCITTYTHCNTYHIDVPGI